VLALLFPKRGTSMTFKRWIRLFLASCCAFAIGCEAEGGYEPIGTDNLYSLTGSEELDLAVPSNAICLFQPKATANVWFQCTCGDGTQKELNASFQMLKKECRVTPQDAQQPIIECNKTTNVVCTTSCGENNGGSVDFRDECLDSKFSYGFGLILSR